MAASDYVDLVLRGVGVETDRGYIKVDERCRTSVPSVFAVGDVVQMDLQLRSLSALLVGPFAAITPIMLLSAFWPEPREEGIELESVPAV